LVMAGVTTMPFAVMLVFMAVCSSLLSDSV